MEKLKIKIMKFKIKNIIIMLLTAVFLYGCDDNIKVESLEFSDSSFKEVKMFLREIKDNGTTLKDLTVSNTVDKTTKTVTVVVKYTADITQLYARSVLERGASVKPIGDAPAMGTVGDFSTPHKYMIETPNGGAEEWTVIVVLADPPPPSAGPTGFELIKKDGTNKNMPLSTFPTTRGEAQNLGNALLGFDYNGSDQYASVDGAELDFRATQDFSISFWVKTTATNSDPSMVGDKDWNGGSNPGFVFAFTGGTWKLNAGGGGRIDIGGHAINDGKWHNLAATFDRDGVVTLYEDGVNIGTKDISGLTDMTSGNPINIAQDGTGSYGSWFNGSIANVKLFDYVLTENQVLNLGTTGAALVRSSGINKYLTVEQFNGSKFIDFGSGKFGFSYDDSQTQYSSITDGGALDFRHSGDFSVTCWVKTTATNSDPSIIGDKDWNSGSKKGFVFAFLGGKWMLNAGDGSNRIDITGNIINNDEWHLLGATFNRTSGKATLYQDGMALGNKDISAFGSMNSGYTIHIAEDGTGSYGPFTGMVANSTIFDYALTDAQMLALFNNK